MVKTGGAPGDWGVAAHVAYARSLGFNALWLYAADAGGWSKARAPRRPLLTREFRSFASRCRKDGLSLWVSVNPVADEQGAFVFSDRAGEDRIVRFAQLLHKEGVRELVLSFDDQPTELLEFRDVARYGRSAAPAHLDLARRVHARLPAGMRMWLCAAVYCDAHLGRGEGPYSKPFLEGIAALPREIGIVWTGPTVVSTSIRRADIAGVRERLGGRELLLYDNFPMNDETPVDAFALSLAPLHGRDPGLAGAVAAYLACPMQALGGSRFTLATIAAFLRDPAAYDPKAAREAALQRLAGPEASKDTRFALGTQQLEWSAFPRDPVSPTSAAAGLHDPALLDAFTWTAARYPGRIAALEPLADPVFRDDLLRAMRRRLAVARALPLAVEYLARRRAGREDAAQVLARIEDEWASWSGHPEARAALESFLSASGIRIAPGRPS